MKGNVCKNILKKKGVGARAPKKNINKGWGGGGPPREKNFLKRGGGGGGGVLVNVTLSQILSQIVACIVAIRP